MPGGGSSPAGGAGGVRSWSSAPSSGELPCDPRWSGSTGEGSPCCTTLLMRVMLLCPSRFLSLLHCRAFHAPYARGL